MPLKINDDNYGQYKLVFQIIWSHFKKLLPPISADADPLVILDKWEKKNKRLAKSGLKSTLIDLISELREFPADLLHKIDEDLVKNDLPNTKILQAIATTTIAKVLNRKQIKTEEEFYIVKEFVCALDSGISDEERIVLDKCMTEFEFAK